jgi:uncharacterized membrane protein YeaQ/YmgE (transglycosylase-associated protein family)
MPVWSLLVWLAVGAIAGLLARKLVGGQAPFGLIGDIVLGIAGGVVGGFMLALAGVGATVGGLIGTVITAIIGAVVLIWASNFIKTKS